MFYQTYDLQLYNQSVFDEAMHNFTRPGGCREQLQQCQRKLAAFDTVSMHRIGDKARKLCDVEEWCEGTGERLFHGTNRGRFDIAHPLNDPFPPPHLHGFLADADTLSALGSPVNFSSHSMAVAMNFDSTLDIVQGGFLDAIGYLLDSGVKVHMVYGDRDFACNWFGGEKSSLSVPYSRAEDFRKAGYAPLITSEGESGMTRQFGNFSFTRLYQAGHMIPSYQPIASYDVFMRALFNKDIPTGLLPVNDELSTVGPSDTLHIRHAPPKYEEPKCYVLARETCTDEQWAKVVAGDVEVKDYFVVDKADQDFTDGEL